MGLIISAFCIVFLGADCWFYAKAAYPQRTEGWYRFLPGWGIVAYIKFGPDKD